MASLGIVERPHRGAVEKQFFDCLYLAGQLHRQLGGLELLLRGAAVCYAVDAADPPPVRLGSHVLHTLSDRHGGVPDLLAGGVLVWVEESGLRALGVGGSERLLDGVRRVADGALAARWPDYRMVFYL